MFTCLGYFCVMFPLWACSTGADPVTNSRVGCKSREPGTKIQKKVSDKFGQVSSPQQDLVHPGLSRITSGPDLGWDVFLHD